MEEDDPRALSIICDILHHRNEVVHNSLTPQGVLELAIAADKYDCIVALRHASAEWMRPSGVNDLKGIAYLPLQDNSHVIVLLSNRSCE